MTSRAEVADAYKLGGRSHAHAASLGGRAGGFGKRGTGALIPPARGASVTASCDLSYSLKRRPFHIFAVIAVLGVLGWLLGWMCSCGCPPRSPFCPEFFPRPLTSAAEGEELSSPPRRRWVADNRGDREHEVLKTNCRRVGRLSSRSSTVHVNTRANRWESQLLAAHPGVLLRRAPCRIAPKKQALPGLRGQARDARGVGNSPASSPGALWPGSKLGTTCARAPLWHDPLWLAHASLSSARGEG